MEVGVNKVLIRSRGFPLLDCNFGVTGWEITTEYTWLKVILIYPYLKQKAYTRGTKKIE